MADSTSISQKEHAANLSNIFSSLIENLQLVVDQLKGGESSRAADPDFSLQPYWTKTEQVIKLISKEATKLSIAFSDPELPSKKGSATLIESMEKAALGLVSMFYSLPKTQGLTLRRQTQQYVILIIQSVQQLASVLQTEGPHGSKRHLQSTGSVWELCDMFPSLPKDNGVAVLKVIRDASGLIKDALEEIEEELQNSDGGQLDDLGLGEGGNDSCNEDTWSEEDKKIIAPCVGLVKVARSFLKKSLGAVKKNSSCDSEGNISQLDDVADVIGQISPAVDNLICCLYGPVRREPVRENATILSNTLNQVLDKCSGTHITTEDDMGWIEFLHKAVDHNKSKLMELTPQGT